MIALIFAAIVAGAALLLLQLDRRRATPTPANTPTHEVVEDTNTELDPQPSAVPVVAAAEYTSPVDYHDAPADMDDAAAEQYVELVDDPTPTLADIDTEVEQSLDQVPTVNTPVYRTLADTKVEEADAHDTTGEAPAPEVEVGEEVATPTDADAQPVEIEAELPALETDAAAAPEQEVAEDAEADAEAADQSDAEAEAAVEDDSTDEAEADAVAESEAESAPDSAVAAPLHPLLKAVPIIARRERKTWAETNHFEYLKEDDYLGDEWSRGPAATPGTARDIVRGVVCGYDMHLLDLGGATLLALRRAAISDVVIEAHTDQAAADPTYLGGPTIGRFTLSASEDGVLDRLVDSRLTTAIGNLPDEVEMFWAESDWVVAQLPKKADPQTWDDTCAPLAMIADVMHALPASGLLGTWPTDGLDVDPTRPLPAPTGWEPPQDTESAETIPVTRPEEPVDMPTRALGASLGHVPMADVGGDELDAIAEKLEGPNPHGSPKLLRNQPLDSTIFHDADSRPHDGGDDQQS